MSSIYGDKYEAIELEMKELLSLIDDIRHQMKEKTSIDPIEHLIYRIKSDESMREKCRRKGLEETQENALRVIRDAIGLRIVCSFLDDVYMIRDAILHHPNIQLIEEKDYIKHVKPNGYRSYHMIIQTANNFYAEIQLRTISMDTWASLEHHLRYKKDIQVNKELISAELKRCANELASADISMQAIRDMIFSTKGTI